MDVEAGATSSPLIEVIGETTTNDNPTDDTMETETITEPQGEKALEPWEERILDAKEILSLASLVSTSLQLRPTTKMHLEALGKRLQKEGEALQRVASSKGNTNQSLSSTTAASITTLAAVPEPTPVVTVTNSQMLSSSVKYVPIDRFAFDAGGYNDQFITLYIDLDNVGTVKQNVSCTFTKSSFDLIVKDIRGKSYRLYKDSLEKDIDPDKSKYVVKANKIVIKLAKVKTSEYGGYDYWTKLTDPKKSSKSGNGASDSKRKDDPSASIMDMMKQMYDEGDDNMKKIIGETMMKQRNGELGKDRPGMGGMGGMPDFDGMDDT